MRPIKLIMSAFGSYGGVECIEFDKLHDGLFLITGDTGAGKTTIFDGISYALYGQTSGRRRDGDMMRSQYAKDTDETYIDENRINAVVNAVKRRIQNLEQIIRERQSEIFAHSYSSTEDDVEENVAEDYSAVLR